MTPAPTPRTRRLMTLCTLLGLALLLTVPSCGNWQAQMPTLPTFGDDEPATPARTPARTSTTSKSTSAYPGPDAVPIAVIAGIAGEPDIRVRLRDGTTTATIGLTGGDALWVLGQDRARPAAAMRPPVAVALTESGWTVTDAAGLVARYPRLIDVLIAPEREMLAEGAVGVASTNAPPLGAPTGNLARAASTANLASKLTLDRARFGGKFILSARSDISPRTFDLVEDVGIEEYLVGVVAAEMWPSWPRQAFGAQAVAARSYAIQQRQLARSQGERFDVESSVRDQAYKGASENPTAALAVRDTQGVVLTWNSQVLRAYYSSTAGPNPASARDTWPIVRGFEYNLAGPLQAGERSPGLGQASPYYRWQATRAKADLTARLREWGRQNGGTLKQLAQVTAVRPTQTNAVGRPTHFTITDSAGATHTISAEQLRQASNTEVPGLAKVTKEIRVNSSDMDAWSIGGETITIVGRGFGHGVGLCQYSAKQLADEGEKWPEIVVQFYPGAQLRRAY